MLIECRVPAGVTVDYVATVAVEHLDLGVPALDIAVMGAIDRAQAQLGQTDRTKIRILFENEDERVDLARFVRDRLPQIVRHAYPARERDCDSAIRDFFGVGEVCLTLTRARA